MKQNFYVNNLSHDIPQICSEKKFGQISTIVPTTCTQMYAMKKCRLHQAQIDPSWNPLQRDYISTYRHRPYELCTRCSAVDI
jgi:hypothetical protein